jgi:hypothetical protein
MAETLNSPSGKEMGTLSGGAPGAIEHQAPTPKEPVAPGPSGKEAGTLAGAGPNAKEGAVDPAAGKATSAQDVRLQQQGLPTMAQGGDPRELQDRMNQAQAALDKARSLDQQGDESCREALQQAQQFLAKTE